MDAREGAAKAADVADGVPVPEGSGDGDDESEGDGVINAEDDGLADAEAEVVAAEVRSSEAYPEADGVALEEPDGVAGGEDVGRALLRDGDVVTLEVAVTDTESVAEVDGDIEPLSDSVADGDVVDEAADVGTRDAGGEPELDGVELGELEGVAKLDAETALVNDGVPKPVADTDCEGVAVAEVVGGPTLGDGEAEGVGLGVDDTETAAEAESAGDDEPVTEGVADGVAEGDDVDVAADVGTRDAGGEPELDRVELGELEGVDE